MWCGYNYHRREERSSLLLGYFGVEATILFFFFFLHFLVRYCTHLSIICTVLWMAIIKGTAINWEAVVF